MPECKEPVCSKGDVLSLKLVVEWNVLLDRNGKSQIESGILGHDLMPFFSRQEMHGRQIYPLGNPARVCPPINSLAGSSMTGIDWWVLPCQEDRLVGRMSKSRRMKKSLAKLSRTSDG